MERMAPEAEGGTQRPPAGVEIELRRELGLLDVVMIGLGPTLGSTIFILLGLGIKIAGPALLLAFVLNFLITMLTAMAYAELSSAFPETGGGYLWVKEGLPLPFGFMGGWMSWFGHCIVCAFYVLGFGIAINWLLDSLGWTFFGLDAELTTKLFAITVTVVFVALNYVGAKSTTLAESLVTAVMLGLLVVFIVFGLVYVARLSDISVRLTPFLNSGEPGGSGYSNLLISMGFTFIIFEGYEIIAQTGEEAKDPTRTIPRASFITIGIATAIFLLVAFITIVVLPLGWWQTVTETEALQAVARASGEVIPFAGFYLIIFGTILGSVAAVNSMIYSASRVSFAMSRDKSLPRFLSRIHGKNRTPHWAIVVSGGMIIAMVAFLPIQRIAAAADILFLLLFFLVNLAAITLRIKRPDAPRAYLMPLFPLIPIAGLLTKLVLSVFLFQVEPFAWYLALFWIMVGLLGYYWVKGKREIETVEAKPKVDLLRVLESPKTKVDPKKYRVLVPLAEFDDTALVELGGALAREGGGEVVLMNVLEAPATLPLSAVGFSDVSENIAGLETLEKQLRKNDLDTRSVLKISHDTSATILGVIKEEEVNLVVLGWRGKPVGEKKILGSTIDHVLQEADCDVLVFKSQGLPAKVRNIAVVSGPEFHVSAAAALAAQLAKQYGATLTILSVVPEKSSEETQLEYGKRLVEIARKVTNRVEHKMIYNPDVVDAIVSYGPECDLLVIGASEEWVLRKYALGPLQDRIVRLVDRPVLMLRKVAQTSVLRGSS